ncbi:bruno 1 isoform X4 [Oratosquilla oratoria]|uniref:bruno 1 isoform X4 n=1 Tax=Oratosquilla oratoria TaxID=337810 RepID=UPI003F765248
MILDGFDMCEAHDRVMNSSHREPDADSIKMFVGQIPRSMDEADLKKMFEDYGEVYQINVLRDKVTGQSKGCCFVTFYTRKAALDAQNAMHNIKTLTGMHHPIQMKPADTENRNERKLFVGMLSKRYNEQDVRVMFSAHGTIEECTVLRDTNGQSKGCAFVTFSSRQCAINAIKKMHHSQTMEARGCSSPLVVKFADTQKEKDAKRLQHVTQNLWSMATANNLASLGPQYLAQQVATNSGSAPATATPNLANQLNSLPQLNNINVQQLLTASQGSLGQQVFESSAVPFSSSAAASLSGLGSLGAGLNLQTPTSSAQETNLQGLLASMNSQNTGLGVNMQNLATLAAMTGGTTTGLPTLNQPTVLPGLTSSTGFSSNLASLPSASSPAGKQIEGPEGANLFIYHLPQEFTDLELAQAFWPFGKVISAKVFIDKQTNLSKCFGFVSYESAMDAQRAIQHMNGQQIGNKRLKVQLKRSKSDGKPY